MRVIDSMGVQLGIKPTQEALRIAESEGLDLVEIAPMVNPPVCKIIDFAKFKYEALRKWKDTHKKQKAGALKEVRFTPTVGQHDLDTKLKHIEEFLKEKDKVRVTVFFRGREMEHQDLGTKLIARVREMLKNVAKVDKEPMTEGKRMSIIFSPK